MKTLHVHKIIEKDSEIHLTNLPYKKGQQVEIIVQPEPTEGEGRRPLTARQLLNSGLIGLWKDRTDIKDSAAYARMLREKAQRRERD